MKSDKTNPVNSETKTGNAASSKIRIAKTDPIPSEFNGPKGPEPTRYGDWEQKGRCTDF